MAKDPAFLFYSSDFLTGTALLTDEQVGKYTRLLCYHHQKGRLTESEMLKVCGFHDPEIFSKFSKDEKGNYYNYRLESEVEKRKKYSESRRQNRNKANNHELFIYLMKDEKTGLYKIGSSVDPIKRLSELKQQFPQIKLLRYFGKTSQATESELHKMFSKKQVKNEFFELDLQDIQHMSTHMTVHMSLHMYPHMENENENINSNSTDSIDYHIVIGGEKFFFSKERPPHAPKPFEVVEAFARMGKSTKDASEFFNYYEGLEWKKGITPIANWVAFANRWVSNNQTSAQSQQRPQYTITDRDQF